MDSFFEKCYVSSRVYGFYEQVTLFSCVHFVNALVIHHKPNPEPMITSNSRKTAFDKKGFTLIITISLLVLLTMVAVGVLSLSSVTLRSSSQGLAQQEARANARMALMMAIGQIQKNLGPDQRITTEADQLSAGGSGDASSAAEGQKNWTGVYRSWLSTETNRPSPNFLTWLTSGDPDSLENVTFANTAVPQASRISLVDQGTVGNQPASFVHVPVTKLRQKNGRDARLAWWVGDQSVKATLMSPTFTESASIGATRQKVQAAPRSAVQLAATENGATPFESLKNGDESMPKLVSWNQSDFISSDPDQSRQLFHDIAPFSSGLLTNVRAGGFRKDLSMQLQLVNASATTPANFVNQPLYSVNGNGTAVVGKGTDTVSYGINLGELGAYYALSEKLTRSGTGTFTSGGGFGSGTPHLRAPGPGEGSDQWFFFKQPTIISFQMIFSLQAAPATVNGATSTVLHLICDPVVTLWNPYDVPLVIPNSSFMSVKYWQIPYDFYINGTRYPMVSSVGTNDRNYFTLRIGNTGSQIVMKPGEVLKYSQTNGTVARSARDIDAKVGFNFGGGVRTVLQTQAGASLPITPQSSITFECRPNNLTAGKRNGTGNSLTGAEEHTRHFSMTHHEIYTGFDRTDSGASLGYGNMSIDYDFGRKRLAIGRQRADTEAPSGAEKKGNRLYANNYPDVFPTIPGRTLTGSQLIGSKSPIMIFAFNAKTENSSTLGSRALSRFNPKSFQNDFYDLSRLERQTLPFEIQVEPLSSWKNRSIEASTNGQGFFGGGMTAADGSNFVTTHSIPREPIVSLAAFQHSMANGFIQLSPTPSYATINARDCLLPQISHAIGNSLAPPMLSSSAVSGVLSEGRAIADHSYLANRELWDTWFLSGLANYSTNNNFTSSEKKGMKTLCQEFLEEVSPLPCVRYIPAPNINDAATLANRFISGSNARPTPTTVGINSIAAYMRVDGMFNVNSTSVEAWKAQLAGLRDRTVITRDANGRESVSSVASANTPVAGLFAPFNAPTETGSGVNSRSPMQWMGQRRLSDDEVNKLALGIVREVRKRGPFLSLSDFVNRRPGTDANLAKSGAIQSALDDPQLGVNGTYDNRGTFGGNVFPFPAAEAGPISYGIPGIVKQADILTPIAPILTTRSDSFIIRAYGESVDAAGKVLARAWCEAVVERSAEYIDSTNAADVVITNASTLAPLTETNKAFGRRCQLVSLRWLQADEI